MPVPSSVPCQQSICPAVGIQYSSRPVSKANHSLGREPVCRGSLPLPVAGAAAVAGKYIIIFVCVILDKFLRPPRKPRLERDWLQSWTDGWRKHSIITPLAVIDNSALITAIAEIT